MSYCFVFRTRRWDLKIYMSTRNNKKTIKSTVVIKKVKVYRKNLSRDKVVGYAYSGSDPYIEIDPNQSDKEYFLTCVHELCHILLPELSEKQIIKIENTFGKTLWVEYNHRLRINKSSKKKK